MKKTKNDQKTNNGKQITTKKNKNKRMSNTYLTNNKLNTYSVVAAVIISNVVK